jgi:hypothetical protein
MAMDIVGKVKKENKDEKKEEIKEVPKTVDGKIDVAKKYNLSGGVLSQDRIDEIVKKYRKQK